MWSGPTMSTGQNAQVRASSEPVHSTPRAATPLPVRASSVAIAETIEVPTTIPQTPAPLPMAPRRSALGLLGWLVATPWSFPRLAGALRLRDGEPTRLEHRWGRAVTAVIVLCDFTVAVLALSRFRAY